MGGVYGHPAWWPELLSHFNQWRYAQQLEVCKGQRSNCLFCFESAKIFPVSCRQNAKFASVRLPFSFL